MSKYQTWYDQIIERAIERELDCYSEWHHILPRSLDGGDEGSNLVQLTYREHFLVHWLLTKLYTGKGRRSMQYALQCMGTMGCGQRIIAAWQFEVAKRAMRDLEPDLDAEAARVARRIAGRRELLARRKAKTLQEFRYLKNNRERVREEIVAKSKVVSSIPKHYQVDELKEMSNLWLKFSPEPKRRYEINRYVPGTKFKRYWSKNRGAIH